MNQKKNNNHGGARPNAGRKPGVKIGKIKPETILFSRRVTNEEFLLLDEYLKKIRSSK